MQVIWIVTIYLIFSDDPAYNNTFADEDRLDEYELPEPSLGNLQKTCDIFSSETVGMSLHKKEKISLALLKEVPKTFFFNFLKN